MGTRLRAGVSGAGVSGWGALALVLMSSPEAAAGQRNTASEADSAQVIGVLREIRTGVPVADALVIFTDTARGGPPIWSGLSDAQGSFRTDPLPLGTYEMMVEGGASHVDLLHEVELDAEGLVDVWVELSPVDFELEPIIVVARRVTKLESGGFYRRRAAGRGAFFTRDDLARISPSRLTETFRLVPGVRIIQGRSGEGNTIRLRNGCEPLYVLDGAILSGFVVLDNLLPINGIEGIEILQGPAVPMEYVGMTTCGVVILWSRDPNTGEGRPFSLRRLAVLITFGSVFYIFSSL